MSKNNWKLEHREEMREYMRQYHIKHRKKLNARSKAWYWSNRELTIRRASKYQSDGYKKNPQKYIARSRLNKAVKAGSIKKPKRCSSCRKSDCRIEGHHEDYLKPLDVIWLCSSCHRYADLELAERRKLQ